MKKIIITIAIFICAISMNAQTEHNQNLDNVQYNYIQYFDSTIGKNLILERIPHKVLYNRVLPWSKLDQWTEKSITSKTHLIQTWFDLATSSYQLADNYSFAKFKASLNNFKLYSYAPLIIINFGYGAIDSLAMIDGRLSIDTNSGVITDNNLAQTPYANRTARLGGVFLDEASSDRPYKFSLQNNYYLNNTKSNIVNAKIYNKTTN